MIVNNSMCVLKNHESNAAYGAGAAGYALGTAMGLDELGKWLGGYIFEMQNQVGRS